MEIEATDERAWIVEDFCTLPTAAQPFRLMEFDELFRSQIRSPRRIDPHRVEFSLANADGLYARVADLVAREKACERRGLLAGPGRSPGGHRLYPPEAVIHRFGATLSWKW
jgi:hypothetical protein